MRNQGQLDDDATTMIILGILFGPASLTAGLGVLASQIPGVAGWLVEHHFLVAEPALEIPGAGGAGLDWLRIIPMMSLLAIALVWSVWLVRAKAGDVTDDGAKR